MVFGGGSRRLEVLLELRDKFTAQMKQAGAGLDKFNDSLKAARPVLLGITGAVAGVGVVSVKLASDLEEATNKANVTFGDASRAVQEFAETSGRAFGISQRAANEYTATLGNILQASGLSQKATADMSVELTKLAADLASFNNLSIDEALQKLRSGLVGQAEPLRAVGVLLSETAVQAKAMELGLASASGELSEGAKVQARYALILEQTKTAQGDFTRTSEGLANQMRIAKAQMEDAAATLGTTLLPVATKAIGVVNRLVQEVAGLPQGLQTAGIAIAGATGGLAAMGLVIPTLVTGLTQMRGVALGAGVALRALIPALAGVNASMLGVVGIIGAVAIAGTLLWGLTRAGEKSRDAAGGADALAGSMRKLQAAAGEAGQALGDTDAAIAAVSEAMVRANHVAELVTRAGQPGLVGQASEVEKALATARAAIEQYGLTIEQIQPILARTALSHELLAPLLEAAAANTARLSGEQSRLQTIFKAATDEVTKQTRDVGDLDQKLRDFSETTRNTTFLQERVMALYAKSAEQLSIYEGVASLAAESVWNIGIAAKASVDPLEEMRATLAQDTEEAARFGREALASFQGALTGVGGLIAGMAVLGGVVTSVNQGIANIKTPGGATTGVFDVAPFPWEYRDVAPPGVPIGPPPGGAVVNVTVNGSVLADDLASIIAREMREIERRGM